MAISDNVVNAIASVTGLPTVDPTPPPSSGVVRAAGADRFATAAAIGDLLGDYNPAALPADAQAVDSDLLDGKDTSEFLSSAAGSVGTDEVADGSLRLTDMAVFSEKITVDPPAIAAQSCVTEVQAAADVEFEDVAYVRPSANIGSVTVTVVSPVGDGTIKYNLCNPTASAVNPASRAWKFVAFRP